MLLVSLNLSSEYVRPTKVLVTAHKVVSLHVQSPAPCKGTTHIIHPQLPSGEAYCATQKCNATVETFEFWRRHLER